MKDKLTHVTDPKIIAAIERNDFYDPIPVEKTDTGYWVYTSSLEQYQERRRLPATDEGKQ